MSDVHPHVKSGFSLPQVADSNGDVLIKNVSQCRTTITKIVQVRQRELGGVECGCRRVPQDQEGILRVGLSLSLSL
jgi:hypothetical protein